MSDFEFLSPDDKPALLALSTPDLLAHSESVLQKLGYKIHTLAHHSEFQTRYLQANYEIFITEEAFAGAATLAENETLVTLQNMPMNQRRHSTTFLFGNSFQSLNPMQAFQQSVHAVVNPSELANFESVVQKVHGENQTFLKTFNDVLTSMASGDL